MEWLARAVARYEAALGGSARWRGALSGRRLRYRSDFAVLVRNTEVIPEFTAAFDEAGIPYVVNRGKGFYETREVNDLVHLLRVIANPRDEISLAAVLRSPLVGVSDEALLGLKAMASSWLRAAAPSGGAGFGGGGFLDPATAQGGPGIQPPENIGAQLMRLAPNAADFDAPDRRNCSLSRPPARLAHAPRIRHFRPAAYWKPWTIAATARKPAPARRANIEKFLAQAREASRRKSLDNSWTRSRACARPTPASRTPRGRRRERREGDDRTFRQGAGISGGVRGGAAQGRGIEPARGGLLAAPSVWARAGAIPPSASAKIRTICSSTLCARNGEKREQQESDRLLYVAMTRAEEHLVLSFSARKNWARDVADRLLLTLDAPRRPDRHADGAGWQDVEAARGGGRERAGSCCNGRARRSEPAAPEEQLLDPPAPADRQDSNATVTALAKFAICPREYFLRQYVGFEGRPRKLRRPRCRFAGERAGYAGACAAGRHSAGGSRYRSCPPGRHFQSKPALAADRQGVTRGAGVRLPDVGGRSRYPRAGGSLVRGRRRTGDRGL